MSCAGSCAVAQACSAAGIPFQGMAIQLSIHGNVLELFVGAVAASNFLIDAAFSHGGYNNSFLVSALNCDAEKQHFWFPNKCKR